MSVTTGLQLPFGIQPVNPVPVDSWSGPFAGADVSTAKATANAAIPSAIRFQSMEVRLIVGGVSRKFWYRDGIADADLVEFSSDGGGGATDPAGSDTQVQFNDGGSFGASPNFIFDKSTSTLIVNELRGSLTELADGSPYLIAGPNVSIDINGSGQITIGSTVPSVLPVKTTVWMEIPEGEADGVNMVFSLEHEPEPASSLMFFVNGVLQIQGLVYDYVLDGNTVTLLNAPNEGSNLAATYIYEETPGLGENTMWMEIPEGEVDGVNSVFSLQHSPYPISAIMFYVNGVLQIQGENYDFLAEENLIILHAAPVAGSNLSATYPY